MSTTSDVMDAKELAAKIGLSYGTIRQYLSNYPDRLPPRVKWSGKLLWSRAVVEAWIEARNGMEDLKSRLPKPKKEQEVIRQRGRPRRVPQ